MTKKKNIIDRPGMYLNKWATFLGLSQTYSITLFIVNKIEEDTLEGDESAAELELQLPYRKAALRLTRLVAETYDDFHLEYVILHELLHLALKDTMVLVRQTVPEAAFETWKRHNEDTCDMFTRILIRLEYPDLDEMIDAHVEDPKPKAKGK